jgi:hypothetical protein
MEFITSGRCMIFESYQLHLPHQTPTNPTVSRRFFIIIVPEQGLIQQGLCDEAPWKAWFLTLGAFLPYSSTPAGLLQRIPWSSCIFYQLAISRNIQWWTYDGQDAAAGALSNAGAGGLEGSGIRGNVNGVAAVEVRDAENIGGTALSGAVEAGAGDVDLTVLHGGGSSDHGGHEGSGNGEELHFDG